MEKSLAQPMSERDAERETGCRGETDKMMGMVKKIGRDGLEFYGRGRFQGSFHFVRRLNRRVRNREQKDFLVRRARDQRLRESHVVGATTTGVAARDKQFRDRKSPSALIPGR